MANGLFGKMVQACLNILKHLTGELCAQYISHCAFRENSKTADLKRTNQTSILIGFFSEAISLESEPGPAQPKA